MISMTPIIYLLIFVAVLLLVEGLYLMVPQNGKPYWMLRYTLLGRRRSMTIAKCINLSLADARGQAAILKQKINQGEDPIAIRSKEKKIEFKKKCL